jgi:hypothetical protein
MQPSANGLVATPSDVLVSWLQAVRLPASASDGSGTESRGVTGRTAAQAEARGAIGLNGRIADEEQRHGC